MEDEFNVGKITLNIRFDKEKLLKTVEGIADREGIVDMFINARNNIAVYGGDDFYEIDVRDYLKIGN